MENKENSPLQLLIAICEEGETKKVTAILDKYKEYNYFISLGYGTDNSVEESLFGFDTINREIVLSVVNESLSETIIESIDKETNMSSKENRGIVFTVNLSGIEKEFYHFVLKGA